MSKKVTKGVTILFLLIMVVSVIASLVFGA